MRVQFYKHPKGASIVGAIDLPTAAPGRLTVAAVGDSRATALAKAALVAERIASDPIMSALMPPQATAAIKAAKGLAAAAQRGTKTLRGFWRRLRGPGKRRLAEALHADAAVADVELGYVDADELGAPLRATVERMVRARRKRRRVMARVMMRRPPRARMEPEDMEPEDMEPEGPDMEPEPELPPEPAPPEAAVPQGDDSEVTP